MKMNKTQKTNVKKQKKLTVFRICTMLVTKGGKIATTLLSVSNKAFQAVPTSHYDESG